MKGKSEIKPRNSGRDSKKEKKSKKEKRER